MVKNTFLRHHLLACHSATFGRGGIPEHLFDFTKVPDFALHSEEELLERFCLELVTQVSEAMNVGDVVQRAGYVLKTGKNTFRVSAEFIDTVEKTLTGMCTGDQIDQQSVATTTALLFGTLGILYADELAREKRMRKKA